MLMRSIGATLILSGVVASAIALAQSPNNAANQSRAQVAEGEVRTLDSAAQQLADVQRLRSLPGSATPAIAPAPADPFGTDPNPFGTAPVQVARAYPARALSPEEIQQAKEFRDAVEQLRAAGNDEQKVAARERLNEMISAQLDRDFEQREQKLAEIEARAKELRDQLEHRRNSKGEIQKMLLMLIENPEAGLGLPPAWMNSVMSQPGAVTVFATPYGVAPATTPQYAPLKRPPAHDPDPFGTRPASADPFSTPPAGATDDANPFD